MTVTITEHRYAVEYRPRGSRKWQTIVAVGSAAVATQAMYDLMGGRSGDWRVSQVAGPPASAPKWAAGEDVSPA